MARNGLEEKLESITRQFVVEIVSAIRGASFAEVAELQVPGMPSASRGSRATTRSAPNRVSASPASSSPASSAANSASRPRQTADRRAELADRLVKMLEGATEPMGVRTLASELGVAVDLLAVPLRELRASGKIAKHGEKRATTYSMA